MRKHASSLVVALLVFVCVGCVNPEKQRQYLKSESTKTFTSIPENERLTAQVSVDSAWVRLGHKRVHPNDMLSRDFGIGDENVLQRVKEHINFEPIDSNIVEGAFASPKEGGGLARALTVQLRSDLAAGMSLFNEWASVTTNFKAIDEAGNVLAEGTTDGKSTGPPSGAPVSTGGMVAWMVQRAYQVAVSKAVDSIHKTKKVQEYLRE